MVSFSWQLVCVCRVLLLLVWCVREAACCFCRPPVTLMLVAVAAVAAVVTVSPSLPLHHTQPHPINPAQLLLNLHPLPLYATLPNGVTAEASVAADPF